MIFLTALWPISRLGGEFLPPLDESLTDKMERGAYEYFDKIEKLGGVLKAIEIGFLQREIADSSRRYQREVETSERTVVGLNDFILEDEKVEIPLLKIDPKVEQEQRDKLRDLREARDNDKVSRSLEALADASRGTDNVMPKIIECARALATLGEICDVFREVYGRWEEPKIF